MKAVSLTAMLAVAIGIGITLAEDKLMAQQKTGAASQLPVEGRLPSLAGAIGWLNTKPLTPADLGGKVVLVDFWTYSCINWLRTEPYVRAWAEKYKDQGLVVIGVHTPEFGFEKDVDNIRWAAKNYRVNYPIAIDSDYAVFGARSTTSIGLRSISSMPTVASATINSARAITKNPRRSYRSC